MMNRQIRRAQEKQDKRAEREKERRKEARREKIQQVRARRLRRREEAKRARAEGGTAAESGAASAATPAPAGKGARKPGRFSGALMMATVFFIVLQSAVPAEEAGGNELLRTITSAGFYLLFGYFSVLWLMRRGTPRPVMMALVSGGFLTLGVEIAKRFQDGAVTDPLMLALAVPGLVAGAFLGRLVYSASPG